MHVAGEGLAAVTEEVKLWRRGERGGAAGGEGGVSGDFLFFLFNWRNSGSLAASMSKVPVSLRESGFGWLGTSRVGLLGGMGSGGSEGWWPWDPRERWHFPVNVSLGKLYRVARAMGVVPDQSSF